jgi:hypothetical protein
LLLDSVPKSPPGWSRFPLAASPTNWELTRFGVFVSQDISDRLSFSCHSFPLVLVHQFGFGGATRRSSRPFLRCGAHCLQLGLATTLLCGNVEADPANSMMGFARRATKSTSAPSRTGVLSLMAISRQPPTNSDCVRDRISDSIPGTRS